MNEEECAPPGAHPEWRIENPTGKKTCWDCVNVRVGTFPDRWCSLYPDRHIYSSPESEVAEEGTTMAESCPSYGLRLGLEPEGHAWDEEGV